MENLRAQQVLSRIAARSFHRSHGKTAYMLDALKLLCSNSVPVIVVANSSHGKEIRKVLRSHGFRRGQVKISVSAGRQDQKYPMRTHQPLVYVDEYGTMPNDVAWDKMKRHLDMKVSGDPWRATWEASPSFDDGTDVSKEQE